MAPITVLVADAQHLFAQSLVGVLKAFPEFQVFDEFPITGSGVTDIAKILHPDVIVLDYWISDMGGPVAIQRIIAKIPGCKVLVLSWFHGPREIKNTLDAGAVGFLPKSVTVEQVAEGIKRAHAGEKPVFAEELGELFQTISARGSDVNEVSKRFQHLTGREIHVLKVLSRGLSIEEAAKDLLISKATLRAHVRSILKKSGTKSRSEAVALALYCGLLQV
ncbi:MAG: LuxR C-terminal-related transcriptional regulator [Actinomycetota bacterium]